MTSRKERYELVIKKLQEARMLLVSIGQDFEEDHESHFIIDGVDVAINGEFLPVGFDGMSSFSEFVEGLEK